MVASGPASSGQLTLLYDVASVLARSREASEGMARALDTIVRCLDWDVGIGWLADREHLRYCAECVSPQTALPPDGLRGFLESVRSGPRAGAAADVGRLAIDQGLCWCGDDHDPGASCAWRPGAGRAGLRCAVAVPLAFNGRVYGVIELYGAQWRAPGAELPSLLLAAATELARFLEARRHETRKQTRNLRLAEAQRIARLAYWECAAPSWKLRGAGNMWEVLGLSGRHLPATVGDYFELVPDEERPGLTAAMDRLRDPAIGKAEFEHHILPVYAGGERVVVLRALSDFDARGEVLRITGTLQDITPYRLLEERLRLAATAIQHAGDAIVIFDARGAIVSTNPAFTRITGYTEEEVRGVQLDGLLNRPSGRHDESFYRRILGRLRTFGRWKGELWARGKDGRDFAMLLSLNEIRDGMSRVTHHVGVFTDVSRQKRYKERLEQLALHDSLTGLPNRALFLDRGQQALALAERNGRQVGLVFIDLDLFKAVNDLHGHAVGDEVLRQAGSRMRTLMRECDTVARLGGDEFVVLLTEVAGERECVAVAERLIEALTRPYQVHGAAIPLGASLGLALSRTHGSDIHTLLRRADQALYSIKRDSVRRYALWQRDQEQVSRVISPVPGNAVG